MSRTGYEVRLKVWDSGLSLGSRLRFPSVSKKKLASFGPAIKTTDFQESQFESSLAWGHSISLCRCGLRLDADSQAENPDRRAMPGNNDLTYNN